MILAVKLGVKGVKKANKAYKKHQAEKQQKLLLERGQLPDLQDPSRELNTTCQAELSRSKSNSSLSSSSSTYSTSTAGAETALENDPHFREYMDQQRALYLRNHRNNANPPSYSSVMGDPQSPVSPMSGHPGRTILPSELHSTTSHPTVAELPPSPTTTTTIPRELDSTNMPTIDTTLNSKNKDFVFELPGNMPAILPPPRQSAATELPAQPV